MGKTLLPGYRREPGTARGYISPTGERISYRQYRADVTAADLVTHLDAVDLANARRKQTAFNDIINQMAKVRRRSLDNVIENATAAGDPELAAELAEERRTLKSQLIKSDARKEALRDLKKFGHGDSAEARERTKLALIALGRREGVPDWVPVGGSDRFRSGKLRRDRIPASMRATGTRRSKG